MYVSTLDSLQGPHLPRWLLELSKLHVAKLPWGPGLGCLRLHSPKRAEGSELRAAGGAQELSGTACQLQDKTSPQGTGLGGESGHHKPESLPARRFMSCRHDVTYVSICPWGVVINLPRIHAGLEIIPQGPALRKASAASSAGTFFQRHLVPRPGTFHP